MDIGALVGLVALTGATTVGVAAVATGSGDSADKARVVRVVDGDTFVADVGGHEQTIRLLNVDTPETKDPDKPIECMGPEATAFLQGALPAGTTVTLRYDQERTDGYGRTLAAVFTGDSLVNAEIARRGLGTAMKIGSNDHWFDQVQSAQQAARSDAKGLYDPATPCTAAAQVEKVVTTANQAMQVPTGTTSADTGVALAALASAVDAANTLEAAIVSPAGVQRAAWALLTDSDRNALRQRVIGARVAATTRKNAVEAEAAQRQQAEAAARAAQETAATTQPQAQPSPQTTPKATSQPRQSSGSSASKPRATPTPAPAPKAAETSPRSSTENKSQGDAAANPYPGYTGPRCYAPGGKTWKPC